MTEEK